MLNMVNLLVLLAKMSALNESLTSFKNNPSTPWIIGRGWDQNDWPSQEFPTSQDLDQFEGVKIYLTRIDGHAAWVNKEVLQAFNISNDLIVEGGSILNGILIDNAESLVVLPKRSSKFGGRRFCERKTVW